MEGEENSERRGFSTPVQQQQRQGWNNNNSPAQEIQQKSGDIPIYFNTNQDGQTANTPSPYPQSQKSPAVSQAVIQGSAGQNYIDSFPYNQQHGQSLGPGRVLHRMPGPYSGAPGWPNSSSPSPAHLPYMSSDRGRPHARPPYPSYDPTKSYHHLPQPGQPQWQRAPCPSPHPAHMGHYSQPDIAGPVVPAGLQALQANNNNAALMQHQHTPMLVPNPHYNQSRAVHDSNPADRPKGDLQQRPPLPDGVMFSSAANPLAPGYYPAPSPHAPQQHSGIGPMHHQAAHTSPNVSPYPVNPGTPGPTKGKSRGNKCYQCPKCVKVFRRGDHLKRHLLSVHDHEHPYQCGECGKGFASVPALLKHTKSLHVGQLVKGLMCLRCHLSFATFQEIETHANSLHVREDEMYMQNINTSSKQHSCSVCPKSFTSAANLKRHMQLLHRSKEASKLFCRECGKNFARIDALRKHVDKIHNGNPSALPPPDELEDSETLSQSHSSESESRGPSADADETSVPVPPANAPWTGYPPPAAQSSDSLSSGQMHGQPLTAPAPGPAYPQNFLHSTLSGHPPVTASSLPGAISQHTQPMVSNIVDPTEKPRACNSTGQTKDSSPGSKIAQDTNVPATSTYPALAQNGDSPSNDGRSSPIRSDHSTLEPAEPESVSEALAMAMKALSDVEYETPGLEMYPYPVTNPSFSPPPIQQQSRMHMPQNQIRMPPLRNGMPPGLNGPRMHGIAPPMRGTQYNNGYDFSRHSGNFLMTVPPPSGSTTMGRLLPRPATAGVSEAPQVSQLHQEVGGGVKIPTTLKSNATYDPMRFTTAAAQTLPSAPVRAKSYQTNDARLPSSGQQTTEECSGNEKVELTCAICKTEYQSIEGLMGHIEGVHLKKNPHECCICHKHFAQAGNVKRHIRFVHLRERPFRCKDCSCTFDRLCYLQRHMRTHLQLSEENHEFNPLKPCACPECGKRCLTAHHLRGHMQRKHFAKNKQNYSQFLAKYGHLEALGTGPGAISNPRGRRGRKAKEAELAEKQVAIGSEGFTEGTTSPEDTVLNSSTTPNSSKQATTLSKFPVYRCPPPQCIPVMQYSTACSMQNNSPEVMMQLKAGIVAKSVQYAKIPDFGQIPMNVGVQSQHAIAMMGDINSMSRFNTGKFVAKERLNNIGACEKSLTTRVGRVKLRRLLPFRCAYCLLKSFSSLGMLKSHLSRAHKRSLKQHVCRKCGASFGKRSYLLSHANEVHNRNKTSRRGRKSRSFAIDHVIVASRGNPTMCAPQQSHGYAHNTSCYNLPIPAQAYYGYDPNSPAMVPSPNVQMTFMAPNHHMPSHIPSIQT